MHKNRELEYKIQELKEIYGESAVKNAINEWGIYDKKVRECTIIVNSGLHSFPESLLRGEVYEFSRGMLDFSSGDRVEKQIMELLIELAKFLRTEKWNRVYIVISGHCILSMQIKMLVYRLTRLETIDWFYDGSGNYYDIKIPMREILSQSRKSDFENKL